MNTSASAFFVAVLGGGVLMAIGASAGWWLVETGTPRFVAWVSSHFERTEIDVTDVLAPYTETGRVISHVTVHPKSEESS